jgi:hypothetical protein
MSRSRAAAELAWRLGDKVGVDVAVGWQSPSRGRPGAWLVEWTDGPTVAAMRGLAADLVRHCRPLTTTGLRFSRTHSIQATAAVLLALAARGELPERPASATMAAEHELTDADTATATWAHLWPQAGDIVTRADGDLYGIIALVHATVTKPRDETPPESPAGTCRLCATPMSAASTGRPARFCGPACRQAAHRTTGAVTKPRHETACAICGRSFTPSATGRPARHCSPACRTRSWRSRADHRP